MVQSQNTAKALSRSTTPSSGKAPEKTPTVDRQAAASKGYDAMADALTPAENKTGKPSGGEDLAIKPVQVRGCYCLPPAAEGQSPVVQSFEVALDLTRADGKPLRAKSGVEQLVGETQGSGVAKELSDDLWKKVRGDQYFASDAEAEAYVKAFVEPRLLGRWNGHKWLADYHPKLSWREFITNPEDRTKPLPPTPATVEFLTFDRDPARAALFHSVRAALRAKDFKGAEASRHDPALAYAYDRGQTTAHVIIEGLPEARASQVDRMMLAGGQLSNEAFARHAAASSLANAPGGLAKSWDAMEANHGAARDTAHIAAVAKQELEVGAATVRVEKLESTVEDTVTDDLAMVWKSLLDEERAAHPAQKAVAYEYDAATGQTKIVGDDDEAAQ
ncbi:MAG: hypothetical protein U1F43_35180 [Myxococcota bacterium]